MSHILSVLSRNKPEYINVKAVMIKVSIRNIGPTKGKSILLFRDNANAIAPLIPENHKKNYLKIILTCCLKFIFVFRVLALLARKEQIKIFKNLPKTQNNIK